MHLFIPYLTNKVLPGFGKFVSIYKLAFLNLKLRDNFSRLQFQV